MTMWQSTVSTLTWSWATTTIAGDPDAGSNGVRSIVLDFGEGETTSIEVLKNGRKEELKLDGVWYDLSGRKVADSSRSSLLQEKYLHREW